MKPKFKWNSTKNKLPETSNDGKLYFLFYEKDGPKRETGRVGLWNGRVFYDLNGGEFLTPDWYSVINGDAQ